MRRSGTNKRLLLLLLITTPIYSTRDLTDLLGSAGCIINVIPAAPDRVELIRSGDGELRTDVDATLARCLRLCCSKSS